MPGGRKQAHLFGRSQTYSKVMRGFPKHVILLVLVAVLKYVVKYWDGFPNTPDLGMEKARKGCMGLASRVTAGTCRGKPGKSLWLLQRWT